MTAETAELDDDACVDGRVLRGQRNREAIVDAMVEMYGQGNLRPTAAQVAEAAGLSTRSVYHHFADMKALVLEVSSRTEARVKIPDFEAMSTLPTAERVSAFAEHRLHRWGTTAAVIHAGELAKYDSPLVTELIALATTSRFDEVRLVFEDLIDPDEDIMAVLAGLDAVFGFETWHRITAHRGIGQETTVELISRMARALI